LHKSMKKLLILFFSLSCFAAPPIVIPGGNLPIDTDPSTNSFLFGVDLGDPPPNQTKRFPTSLFLGGGSGTNSGDVNIYATDYGIIDITGVTNSVAPILAAIAAAPTSGGTVILPGGIIRIDSTIEILNKPLVRLQGIGAEHALYSGVPTKGTVLKWGGVTNGIMMKVGATVASPRAVPGNGVSGIAFDANVLAAYGLQIISSWHGFYQDIHVHNAKTVGLLTTTIDLAATEDVQGCDFINISVTAVSTFAQSGIGIQCTSGAIGIGNTSGCKFSNIQIYHRDGIGWDFGDTDTLTGDQIMVNRYSLGGTGIGIVFQGSDTPGLGHTRHNALFNVQPVGGLTAKGTGLAQPSGPNWILYDFGNSAPTPVIETGAILYGTSTRGSIPVNDIYQKGRNAAGTDDINMWKVNSLNEVETDSQTRFSANVTIGNTRNISFSTSTGSKIGTGTTQKIGFWNAVPIDQQLQTTDLKIALTNIGIISAVSGATPLNLNGGTATGNFTISANNVALKGRNAANSADLDIIKLNALDEIELSGIWRLNNSGTFGDARNLVLGSSTGNKIGTAITQKLGLWNATPVVQQVQTTDLKVALTNIGIIGAASGATPLNLNGGDITANSFIGSGTTADSNIQLPDNDATHFATIQAHNTTLTNINIILPPQLFDGLMKVYVEGVTNFVITNAIAGVDYSTNFSGGGGVAGSIINPGPIASLATQIPEFSGTTGTNMIPSTNNLILWDATQATRSITANLSGANDPVLTFGNNSIAVSGALTLTPILANTTALTGNGYSVTGSGTTPGYIFTGTLNTSGNIDGAVQIKMTNTASGGSTYLFKILGGAAGATDLFRVNTGGAVVASSSFTGTSFISSGGPPSYTVSSAGGWGTTANGVVVWYDSGLTSFTSISLGPNDSSPNTGIIKAPSATGTDTTGGTVIVQAGASTGAGVPGKVQGQRSIVGTTGSSVNTYGTAFALGGVLNVNTTTTGNVGAGEDDLITYSIPAAQMSVNGDSIDFDMAGTFAATVNAKRLRVYFGATAIFDSTSLVLNGLAWRVHGKIIRTGAATQKATIEATVGGTLLSAVNSTITQYTTPGETLSGAVIIKATGSDDGGVPADNAVVQQISSVRYYTAP
jgi:hypothetical protein